MALRSDLSERLCPVTRAVDIVGDPWVLLIIRDVLHGNGRFDICGTIWACPSRS